MIEEILSKVQGNYAIFSRDKSKPTEVVKGEELVVLTTAFYEDKRHCYAEIDPVYARLLRRKLRKEIPSCMQK